MLIQPSIKANDIISIKLITGEELIAKVTDVGADHVMVTKPLVINIGQDRSGNMGIQMLPYFIFCGEPDAKLEIKNSHILVKTPANEQAKNGYLQNTTGLTITTNPASGIIK